MSTSTCTVQLPAGTNKTTTLNVGYPGSWPGAIYVHLSSGASWTVLKLDLVTPPGPFGITVAQPRAALNPANGGNYPYQVPAYSRIGWYLKTAECLLNLTYTASQDVSLNIETNTGAVPEGNRNNVVPPKTLRSFDYQPFVSRGYEGDGSALEQHGTTFMHQGDIGIDGNRRSWAWFDPALGLSDMIGVPIGDVQTCELFLRYPHWFYQSGTAVIGFHKHATGGVLTEPPNSHGLKFQDRIRVPDWQRGEGRWVNLKQDPEWMASIRDGSFRGIVLGDTGNATREHYGYAHGSAAGLGNKPGLRASYYK